MRLSDWYEDAFNSPAPQGHTGSPESAGESNPDERGESEDAVTPPRRPGEVRLFGEDLED